MSREVVQIGVMIRGDGILGEKSTEALLGVERIRKLTTTIVRGHGEISRGGVINKTVL